MECVTLKSSSIKYRGDWFSTFTQHSDATTMDGVDLYPNVTWQWEHKTGALGLQVCRSRGSLGSWVNSSFFCFFVESLVTHQEKVIYICSWLIHCFFFRLFLSHLGHLGTHQEKVIYIYIYIYKKAI